MLAMEVNMIAGVDFPSLFVKDNFTSRRTTGHNLLDPDSLISGAEIAAGLTYHNSSRNWNDHAHYIAACSGQITTEQVLASAPRIHLSILRRLTNSLVIEDFMKEEAYHDLGAGI
jgi:hypothetical protein